MSIEDALICGAKVGEEAGREVKPAVWTARTLAQGDKVRTNLVAGVFFRQRTSSATWAVAVLPLHVIVIVLKQCEPPSYCCGNLVQITECRDDTAVLTCEFSATIYGTTTREMVVPLAVTSRGTEKQCKPRTQSSSLLYAPHAPFPAL